MTYRRQTANHQKPIATLNNAGNTGAFADWEADAGFSLVASERDSW